MTFWEGGRWNTWGGVHSAYEKQTGRGLEDKIAFKKLKEALRTGVFSKN